MNFSLFLPPNWFAMLVLLVVSSRLMRMVTKCIFRRDILTSRTTSSGIHYATANVNGVNGLVLLPDNWNVSIYTLNYTDNHSAPYSTNEITLSDWEILETNGAVFLPAAGWRYGTSIGNPNHDIYYWSTTSYHSYNGYNANALVFPTEYPIYQYISYYRWYGCSVRLVSDIVE